MSFQSICALTLFANASSSDVGNGADTCTDEATLLQSVSRHKIQSRDTQPLGEAEYVGCFVDDPSRDLGAMVGNTGASTNTFATCRSRCGSSIYMSLQYGGECFCADAYGTAPQYVMVDDANCNSNRVPCSEKSHNCGGTWHQAIYAINPQCGGVYEAEDVPATSLTGAQVHAQTNSVAHQGFTGQSFVDYLSADGSIEWNIEHCGAGAASVSFRYALSGGNRPLLVEVNGEVVQAHLSFPPTGSWATWGRTDQVQIPLVAGANSIRLVGTGSSGANVDSMTLTTGTCADQGRYIRHDVGTAIYWEQCGVKYWVQSCSMCDDILDFAHTPCHNHWVDQPQSYIDSLLTGGGFPGTGDGERFECSQHWAYTGLPVVVGSTAMQNTKCPHIHEDRLFRTPSSGSSDVTIVDCYEQCASTAGCNHFSYGAYQGGFVCMGCTVSDEAQTHEGFTLYDMPTHYLTVVSWPAWAWGEWNNDAKGAIEKCSPRETTADADGTGYWFTSCCTGEGAGMQRDCGTTHNTNFETAVEQCAAQGGRLCTADEVVSLDENSGRMTTATQGCSVDGPRTATGGDLNRLWTSTPCSP